MTNKIELFFDFDKNCLKTSEWKELFFDSKIKLIWINESNEEFLDIIFNNDKEYHLTLNWDIEKLTNSVIKSPVHYMIVRIIKFLFRDHIKENLLENNKEYYSNNLFLKKLLEI